MGPKASTPVDSNTDTLNEIKINHPVFSIVQEIRDKQDQVFIKNQVRLPNKNQFDQWAKRVDLVPQNDSLMLPREKQYKSEGFCGTGGVAYITYENFPYLLSDEIRNRKELSNKLFEENELWYLIYTLLSASLTYHQKGVKTGDIRPDNIFINEDGQVKVASVDSWPGQKTNYEKSFFQKQITYLSPEQIKDYNFGKMQQSGDKELAQTFSIGLSSLDAATLSSSKDLYSKNFKFSYQKLQAKLNQVKSYGYSQLLTLTIESMCEVDPEYRSTSREILQWLHPYEEAIVNLEDFEVDSFPQKMRLVRERNSQNKSVTTAFSRPTSSYVPLYTPPQPLTQPNFKLPEYNYQPSTYQPPQNFGYNPQPVTISQPPSYLSNYYAVNHQVIGQQTSENVDIHKMTLQKIDKQLQQSRKLFPQ